LDWIPESLGLPEEQLSRALMDRFALASERETIHQRVVQPALFRFS
jgi:hypothetical protein